MIPKPDIRATDPIFEAKKQWEERHPGVTVQLEYDAAQMVIALQMITCGKSITRRVPFCSYDITSLKPEELTADELEAMYLQLTKGDKDE